MITATKIVIIPALFIGLSSLQACTTPSGAYPGEGPVKTATPTSSSPRLLDCVGENQTSNGTTRPDCLPNKGDEAARDTERGSGASGVLTP